MWVWLQRPHAPEFLFIVHGSISFSCFWKLRCVVMFAGYRNRFCPIARYFLVCLLLRTPAAVALSDILQKPLGCRGVDSRQEFFKKVFSDDRVFPDRRWFSYRLLSIVISAFHFVRAFHGELVIRIVDIEAGGVRFGVLKGGMITSPLLDICQMAYQ